ncbi:hypothetical protein QUF72_08865, partial [Desulfobacterales bacterium HSG2]|nr:hypothetical protein [Desulfobacterales bacterium HSG2]
MKYPLREKIGYPELFVGREKESEDLDKWIANIPKKLSISRVILARRKSGKTAIVQRLFNRLWSDNGDVIPFYFDIGENKIWYPMFAMDYYRAFASQYISFLERDESLVRRPLSLEKIREYGLANSVDVLAEDADSILHDKKEGFHDLMWKTAYSAPHRMADVYDQRILVMLDEFQNLAGYVYPDPHYQTGVIETMPGSFHSVVESKIAPMLVTGSYVSWLLEIAGKYLQAGRLDEWHITPYLTPEKGLDAVYGYARVYNEPVTNETAFLINQLCMSDPFFIACVIQSRYGERKLDTEKGVIETFNYEITDRRSRMSKTWNEYIQLTLKKVNDRYAKQMLLHLSKHSERYWTHKDIKNKLQIGLSPDEIKKRLILLVEADVIEWGSSDIQFRGLRDGTLNLILRNRFEEEIEGFAPDLRQEAHEQITELKREKKRLRGMLSHLTGKFAEYQLATAFRSKKRFALSDYFAGVGDTARLNIIRVSQRVPLQRENGKNMELDVVAESDCGRVAVVEVKKWKKPVGRSAVEDFVEKLEVYAESVPGKRVLPAFLSLGGFAGDAVRLCEERGIGTAE